MASPKNKKATMMEVVAHHLNIFSMILKDVIQCDATKMSMSIGNIPGSSDKIKDIDHTFL